jgi:hypothetical protein
LASIFFAVKELRGQEGRWGLDRILKGGFDLEAPGFEEGFRDVLGVLVAAGPLAEAGGADVLIGGELVFLDDELEGGDGGDDGTDGFGLAPVGVAAALSHKFVSFQGGFGGEKAQNPQHLILASLDDGGKAGRRVDANDVVEVERETLMRSALWFAVGEQANNAEAKVGCRKTLSG